MNWPFLPLDNKHPQLRNYLQIKKIIQDPVQRIEPSNGIRSETIRQYPPATALKPPPPCE